MLNLPIAILWLVFGIVRIDGTDPSGGQPTPFCVFGGQPVKINLAVETPSGDPVEIRADLFQKGQSLLAPLQKDIPVAQDVHSEKNQPLRPLVSWAFVAPEVKRETEMLARLRIKSATGDWTPAGQILLTVYPPTFAQEGFAAFAKKQELRLFGENTRLRAFLKAQKVEFDDVEEDFAGLFDAHPDNGVYIGEATSRELADWINRHSAWRGNLVVFCTDSPLLPGVFVTTQGGLRIAKVTLPLLDTLSSDPRSQKTLLEILKTLTDSQP